MKLTIFPFETSIEFTEGYVNILEVQDKKLFASIAVSLNDILNAEEPQENIMLTENNKALDMAKNTIVLTDICNIDYNSKKIISKLYGNIEEYVNADYAMKKDFESKAQLLINSIEYNLNCDIVYKDSISIADYLKCINVKVETCNYKSIFEKLMGYIELIEELELCKLLIVLNAKTFLEKCQLEEIYKIAIYKKINMLLIENQKDEEHICYENKVIIDENYDDYHVDM